MSRLSRMGRRARLMLAGVLVGGLALSGLVMAPAANADVTTQAITRDSVLQRAATWLTANNGSQVPYSQSRTWGGYRTDCSGYVSMALQLSKPGPNTVGLANTRSLTTPITVGALKPGDLLIDAIGTNTTRHVVIFAGWTSSAHSAYYAYEQRGGHGTDYRVLTYGLNAGSEYKPYRPVKYGDGDDGSPQPPTGNWPSISNGSQGVDVKAAQYLLTSHGISTTADGDFGPLTTSSTKTFQSRNGLVADGLIGPLTWPKLVVTVRNGSQGNAVKALQVELNAHGANLVVDGDFGSLTLAAVKSFQRSKGLVVDGLVGPITWRALVAA